MRLIWMISSLLFCILVHSPSTAANTKTKFVRMHTLSGTKGARDPVAVKECSEGCRTKRDRQETCYGFSMPTTNNDCIYHTEGSAKVIPEIGDYFRLEYYRKADGTEQCAAGSSSYRVSDLTTVSTTSSTEKHTTVSVTSKKQTTAKRTPKGSTRETTKKVTTRKATTKKPTTTEKPTTAKKTTTQKMHTTKRTTLKTTSYPKVYTFPNLQFNRTWFYIDGANKNATECHAFCRNKGMNLTSVHSKRENQFIKNALCKKFFPKSDANCWPALYKGSLCHLGIKFINIPAKKWIFTDGTPADYFHDRKPTVFEFGKGGPCVHMRNYGDWNDVDCGARAKCVCRKKLP